MTNIAFDSSQNLFYMREKADTQITIRVSKTQKEMIVQNAKKEGLTVTQFILKNTLFSTGGLKDEKNDEK